MQSSTLEFAAYREAPVQLAHMRDRRQPKGVVSDMSQVGNPLAGLRFLSVPFPWLQGHRKEQKRGGPQILSCEPFNPLAFKDTLGHPGLRSLASYSSESAKYAVKQQRYPTCRSSMLVAGKKGERELHVWCLPQQPNTRSGWLNMSVFNMVDPQLVGHYRKTNRNQPF